MKNAAVRQKVSESSKGRVSPMKGKHHSIETRKKIAAANTGKISPNKGGHISEKQKADLSKNRLGSGNPMFGRPSWNKGIPQSKEAKNKNTISNGGQNFYILKDDIIIEEFNNLHECAKIFNLNFKHISDCLHGRLKTHRKYKFIYTKDYNKRSKEWSN